MTTPEHRSVSGIEIREARPADRGEIEDLFERSRAASMVRGGPYYVSPGQGEDRVYVKNEEPAERCVAVMAGRIVGHGIIDTPSSDRFSSAEREKIWMKRLGNPINARIVELRTACVDPDMRHNGIWSELLRYRLDRSFDVYGSTPVSAVRASDEHVKRTFRKHGGDEAENAFFTHLGVKLNLFVFR